MNNGYNFAILSIVGLALVMSSFGSSKMEFIFAQNENTLGQEGDGEDASQSENSSQETNQNSMCVSGDSASLSCNNLSSENADSRTRTGEQSPISIQGMIYQKSSSDTEDEGKFLATVACDAGDTAISSNFKIDGLDSQTADVNIIKNTLDLSSNEATFEIETPEEEPVITVYINCFDNH